MGASANIRQNEGTGDITVTIGLLLVHHASALCRVGGAQVTVVHLHGHHSVCGEAAHAKGNHAVLAHRGGNSRRGAGGRCLRTARRQSGCSANAQAQRQGCGSTGGQRLRGQGCLRGSRKRCTHGGPFKITGVEAERYRVRGGAVQRVVTRMVGGTRSTPLFKGAGSKVWSVDRCRCEYVVRELTSWRCAAAEPRPKPPGQPPRAAGYWRC